MCNCQNQNMVLNHLKNPEKVLSTDQFQLVKIHPNNPNKYFYKCNDCSQIWEKLTHPHHYGYSESWKKLENVPEIIIK